MRNYCAWVSTLGCLCWLVARPSAPAPPQALALHAVLLMLHVPWYVEHELRLPTDDVPLYSAAWVLGCFAEAGGFAARNRPLVAGSAFWFLALLAWVPVPERRCALAAASACIVASGCVLDASVSTTVLLAVPALAHPAPASAERERRCSPCRVEYSEIPDFNSRMPASPSTCSQESLDYCMVFS